MKGEPAVTGEAAEADYAPLAEINVTPLVDIMLVLLIVFMVAAPLMVAGLPVDLPRAASAAPAKAEPMVVTIDRDGEVFLGDRPVTLPELSSALSAARSDPAAMVQVRGDRAAAYGQIIAVMDVVSRAGIAKVSLLTAPAQGPAPAP